MTAVIQGEAGLVQRGQLRASLAVRPEQETAVIQGGEGLAQLGQLRASLAVRPEHLKAVEH
jgi:hypothetical protein